VTTTGAPLNLTIPVTSSSGWDVSMDAALVAINDEFAILLTALGDKADLVGGVVPSDQIPPLSAIAVTPAADQAARLALSSATVGTAVLQITDPVNGNGTIYILTATPASANGNWTPVNPGLSVTSVNGETGVLTGYVKLATNNQTFAGTGNAFSSPLTVANATASGHAVNQGQLDAAIAFVNPGLRYEVQIGNGSSTSISLTHNFNKRMVHVSVFDATTYVRYEDVNVTCTSTTVVTLNFDDPPASNSLRALVTG
jgi:hypothetical protein